MKTSLLRFSGWCFWAVASAALLFADQQAGAPKIVRISFEGTNVVIHATAPNGVSGLVIESKRHASETNWAERTATFSTNADGLVNFTIPKSQELELFRLRAGAIAASNTSGDVRYVQAQPLSDTTNKAVSLRFKMKLDGSDRIIVNRQGAVWEHVFWSWPEGPVSINGTEWNPADKSIYAPVTGDLLPEKADFLNAALRVVDGRDTVALERSANGITIMVDDTQNGAGDYEFGVEVPLAEQRKPMPTLGTAVRLKVVADIDGSDELFLSNDGATWTHKTWGWPNNVSINGVAWAVSQDATTMSLTNQLRPNIDWKSAQVVERSGRDLVAVEPGANGVTVKFADNPNGGDRYQVVVEVRDVQR